MVSYTFLLVKEGGQGEILNTRLMLMFEWIRTLKKFRRFIRMTSLFYFIKKATIVKSCDQCNYRIKHEITLKITQSIFARTKRKQRK